MERSSADSASAVTVNESSPCHHRRPRPSDDVIAPGHTCPEPQQVTCSGDKQASGIHPCAADRLCSGLHHSLHGPIRRCSVTRETGTDQGAGHTCCGGGATSSTTSQVNPVSPHSDSDSDSQEVSLTFDPPEVISDDDAFITEPAGELTRPAATATAAATTLSRNTFECGRRQSAPGQLVQGAAGSESDLQSRRPGIVDYFSSRKQRSVSVAGWKLFGKVPPRQSPSKRPQIIQKEFEARQVAVRSSPTHNAAGQQSVRKVECEPLSTTALILEDRPPNLPAKSAEEAQRHRQQYELMVAGAKRRELKEAQRRQQQLKERVRQEEEICSATLVWNQLILPQWDTMWSSRRARDLWWGGLPPSVRGRVWSLVIGNELNVTAELYEIFLSRAKEKRSVGEEEADESSLESISRDVCRTFLSLCVFQKGGPYHDQLQSILGAYTCYRPDVGYVQGMSSVAAMLILNMDELQAFISFSNLINKPCQLCFYRGDHQLMLRYFAAFQIFFEETLPRLFLHFQSSGLTPDLYLMDWILSLYTKPLPLDVACRVWDVFFRDGEEFLFRTALGILRLYQDLLQHMDLISIVQFLSRLPDEELLSDRLFSCIANSPTLSGSRKWSQVLSSCGGGASER